MKLRKLSVLFAAAPLALLCACGGTISNLSFNANWYKNTSLKDNLAGTEEELCYDISFESHPSGGFSLNYTDGVLKTKLQNGNVSLDEATQEGYILTSELTIKVQFTFNGSSSEIFEDKIHSEVQFLSAAHGLKPVRSFKSVYCHSPLSDRPATLANSFAEYDFTYEVDYTDDLSEASVVYTDKKSAEGSETKSYSLKGDGTFLDNEQLLFAFRGLDLSTPVSFRSLNLVQSKVQQATLTTLDQSTAAVDFTADGEQVTKEDLAVSSVTLRYAGTGAGQPQTLIYAKTTDYSSNLYRNVLVEMQVPLFYSLGTLDYRLKTAKFAAK